MLRQSRFLLTLAVFTATGLPASAQVDRLTPYVPVRPVTQLASVVVTQLAMHFAKAEAHPPKG